MRFAAKISIRKPPQYISSVTNARRHFYLSLINSHIALPLPFGVQWRASTVWAWFYFFRLKVDKKHSFLGFFVRFLDPSNELLPIDQLPILLNEIEKPDLWESGSNCCLVSVTCLSAVCLLSWACHSPFFAVPPSIHSYSSVSTLLSHECLRKRVSSVRRLLSPFPKVYRK